MAIFPNLNPVENLENNEGYSLNMLSFAEKVYP